MNVSVLVPVYNAEKTIVACLDSLVSAGERYLASAASGSRFEICCRDDGSRDGSLSALWAYAGNLVRARSNVHLAVSSQPNAGVSATRNALMDSLGEDCDAFAFCDSDDVVSPEIYAALAEALARKGADVAECGWWSRNGAALTPTAVERTVEDMSIYWLKATAPDGWINVVNKLYRRRAVGSIRFRPELAFEEDLFFNSEVNAAIRRKVLLPDNLYEYCENTSSATQALDFRRYFGSAARRIRLSVETFLTTGRVPASLREAYRAELAKDAYRMVIRKNLKKNRDAALRLEIFAAGGAALAALKRDFGFEPTGLNPVQRLVYTSCLKGRYALARALVALT